MDPMQWTLLYIITIIEQIFDVYSKDVCPGKVCVLVIILILVLLWFFLQQSIL